MPLSFDSIPEQLRTPGSFIEFRQRASNWSALKKVLLVGYANDTGADANTGEIYPISRTDIARLRFGYTSMLARMTDAFKKLNPTLDLYAIALTKPEAAVHATGAVTFSAAATTAGVFNVWIDGDKVSIAVANGDTPAQLAAKLTVAINNSVFLPVTATANTGTVDLVAKFPDALGNSITLSTTLYQNKNAVTHTLTAFSGGAGTPDLNELVGAMGDNQYHYIVNPFTDDQNLTLLEQDMNDRWGPMRQIDGRVFMARAGTYDSIRAFGQSNNCPHFTTLGIFDSATPTWLAATVNAAVASKSLDLDPARPLHELALPLLIAPAFRPDRDERNTLLYSGIATFIVTADGICQLERQVTMYQRNEQGFEDDAYLDIEVPETLSMVRQLQRYTVMSKFPRYKLAERADRYGAGQKIVTPKMIKAELISLYENVFMYAKGWVQDLEAYEKSLIVEIHPSDPDRVDYRDEPTLIGQFRVLAGQAGFK